MGQILRYGGILDLGGYPMPNALQANCITSYFNNSIPVIGQCAHILKSSGKLSLQNGQGNGK